MDRGRKIAQFAKDYGLDLTLYRQGMCDLWKQMDRGEASRGRPVSAKAVE